MIKPSTEATKTRLSDAYGGRPFPLMKAAGFPAAPAISAAGQPGAAAPVSSGNHPGVSRNAGSYRGTLANWVTRRLTRLSESSERNVTTTRAEDLIANDPHAASVIDSMAVNTVGTGLLPQSTPHKEILGWTDTQIRDFQVAAEFCFSLWSKEADVTGRLPFWAIQYTTIYSLLQAGEFVRIPVMMTNPDRVFSLAIQSIHPSRLCTPRDLLSDDAVREGIRETTYGAPETYYIANTTARHPWPQYLSSDQYSPIPARIGHRPGIFHSFVPKTDEQVRGVSILAPAMKFFKDLSDYLDFELVGAIIASSFPVFIETTNPYEQTSSDDIVEKFTEVSPGQVLFGSVNQKPHVLKSDRPGNTFPAFVERILRAAGASVGMPYEVIAKDFSKTNYSSARAALLEAWRVFSFYQKWLVDSFCQKIWEMVLEEAWLRGLLRLPKGSPDWYVVAPAVTRATWIPPKRGHVDPLKEAKAIISLLHEDLTTLAEASAETGGDWETRVQQRGRERRMQQTENPKPQETEE